MKESLLRNRIGLAIFEISLLHNQQNYLSTLFGNCWKCWVGVFRCPKKNRVTSDWRASRISVAGNQKGRLPVSLENIRASLRALKSLPPTAGPISCSPALPHFSVRQQDSNLGPKKKVPCFSLPRFSLKRLQNTDPSPPSSASVLSPPLIPPRSLLFLFQFCCSILSSQGITSLQSNPIARAHTQRSPPSPSPSPPPRQTLTLTLT